MAGESADRRHVVVKVDGGEDPGNSGTATSSSDANNVNKIWRGSSYDFGQYQDVRSGDQKQQSNGGDGGFDFGSRVQRTEDPPSKLIEQFLTKQRAAGEISLDMDVNASEIPSRGLTSVAESPVSATYRVVFDTPANGNSDGGFRRRQSRSSPSQPSKDGDDTDSSDSDSDKEGAKVVKCTSNKSFQPNPMLMKTKTRSRLQDPPTPATGEVRSAREMRSGRVQRSGQIKSGYHGKSPPPDTVEEEEEEDPFYNDDIPDEYKKDKLSIWWVLLEWSSLILIIAALVCSLTIPYLRHKTLWDLMLWKWEVMVLVLICGRLVSSWIVRIAVYLLERSFLLRKRVLYFVYGVKKPVQNCMWLGLVLIAWHFLFDKKVERETNSKFLRIVTKILICLLVGVAVWLLKTLFVKVLASSFHMSTYFDRIQDSLYNQYVIETLSGPPLIEIKKIEEEREKIANEVRVMQNAGAAIPPELKAAACPSPHAGRVIGLQKSPRIGKSPVISGHLRNQEEDEGITVDHLQKLNRKNVSALKMKRLINMIRNGALSTLDEQARDATEEDESDKQIKSEYEAKRAAKKIFSNVAKPGSRFIYLEDIMRFMPEDDAWRTLSLFEGASDNERISKSALKNWMVTAFRERRALALTLNDTKTAVNRLNHVVNVLVGIILVIVWLLILGIATTKFLLVVSSQVVLVAFVFGNSCKTVFEAIIFLFVMHPFDVGDRCELDGVHMVVEEMNILTTVFLRYDNQKIIYPNSVLATKAIGNYYRSPDMGDMVEFYVHITTPVEKIALMKQRIASFVDHKKDHWYPSPMIVFNGLDSLSGVRILVWVTHRMNLQDMGERYERRGLLMEEIAKICRDIDIEYRFYPIPINIQHMPPITSDRLPPGWTTPHAS